MLTLRTSPQRAVGPSLLPSFMLQLSDLCAGFPVSTHRCCYPDWCPLSGGIPSQTCFTETSRGNGWEWGFQDLQVHSE